MKFRSKANILLMALALAGKSHAALIAVEQFDYPIGDDVAAGSLNGGSGWGTAWVAHSGSGVMDVIPQVSFGNLQTAGGTRSSISDVRNGRSIDATAAATSGAQITNNGSLYIGFLAQDQGEFASAAGFTLYDDGAGGVSGDGNGVGGNERLFFGSSDTFDGGNFYIASNSIPGDNNTIGSGINGSELSFVKFHLDYSGANTEVTVDLFTGGDLITPATSESFNFGGNLAFDTIRLTRDLTVDEIRIGTTAADVVPIPEPSSALLLCLSGALLLRRKR